MITCRIASKGVYLLVVTAAPNVCFPVLPKYFAKKLTAGEKVTPSANKFDNVIDRVIVGIENRESNERVSSADMSKVHCVRDQRDFPQERQGANLGDIEEPFDSAAPEEVLVDQVQQDIVLAKRQSSPL